MSTAQRCICFKPCDVHGDITWPYVRADVDMLVSALESIARSETELGFMARDALGRWDQDNGHITVVEWRIEGHTTWETKECKDRSETAMLKVQLTEAANLLGFAIEIGTHQINERALR